MNIPFRRKPPGSNSPQPPLLPRRRGPGRGGLLSNHTYALRFSANSKLSDFGFRISDFSSQHAFFLEEALVYISVLLILLGVGFSALYRSIDSSIGLRRNADDLTATIHAGERWRADVRDANSKIWLENNSPEAILHLASTHGEITYRSAPTAIYRRVASGPWVCALTNIASSTMQPDPRQTVTAWRWELELQHRAKGSYIRPLFTFLAVPQTKAAP